MPKLTHALAGGVILLVVLLAYSYHRSSGFEQRAVNAERFATDQKHANEILNDQLTDALKRVAHRDTTIVHDSIAVAAIDSASPPSDSCKPNLAARDHLIADQKDQILDLQTALARAREMQVNSQRSADSSLAALKSRPHNLVNLGFLKVGMPKLGAFAGVCQNGLCYGGGVILPLQIGGQ